jgi:hypothetical protein
MIPYVVPGVVLGLGFVVTFNQPPLLLTGSALIIVLILLIRRPPYAVRSSILRQVKGSNRGGGDQPWRAARWRVPQGHAAADAARHRRGAPWSASSRRSTIRPRRWCSVSAGP